MRDVFNIGITGTQERPTARQLASLGTLLGHYVSDLGADGIVIRHGCCVGVDAIVDHLAESAGIRRVGYPSNIPEKTAACEGAELRPSAPPLERNVEIVFDSDVLIAVPKQDHEVLRSGTWATIRAARKRPLMTIIIWPDGSMKMENVKEVLDVRER